jgi:hypothetical protein
VTHAQGPLQSISGLGFDCVLIDAGEGLLGSRDGQSKSEVCALLEDVRRAVNTSINRPIKQSTNQPFKQSSNQPINQSTNQPINQSTNQSIHHTITRSDQSDWHTY